MANTSDGEVYMIHFPQADSVNNATDDFLNTFGADGVISELMVAGFQHFLEGGIADASNATAKNVELMKKYGAKGLDISAHSRGTDTTGNAMQILLKNQKNIGVLSNTNIHYFGPADHTQDAANQLDQLSSGQVNYVELQNHNVDPVGNWIGRNPSTYGKIPDNSNSVSEVLNAINLGSDPDHTVHNCYGKSTDPQCKSYGVPKTLRIYSNGSKP